jgi:hypothetical protein
LRRLFIPLIALLLAVVTLTGCSSDTATGTSGGPKTIDVTIKGSTVSPNGDRIKVGVGQQIILQIDADKAGQIHVHSTPEQRIEYPAGKSTEKLKLDQPGIVDVESHALDKTIVQLEVS